MCAPGWNLRGVARTKIAARVAASALFLVTGCVRVQTRKSEQSSVVEAMSIPEDALLATRSLQRPEGFREEPRRRNHRRKANRDRQVTSSLFDHTGSFRDAVDVRHFGAP